MTDLATCTHNKPDTGKSIHARIPIDRHEVDFNRQMTISPRLVGEAWANLSLNTRAIEFHELPILMHKSLLAALTTLRIKELK